LIEKQLLYATGGLNCRFQECSRIGNVILTLNMQLRNGTALQNFLCYVQSLHGLSLEQLELINKKQKKRLICRGLTCISTQRVKVSPSI